MHYSYIEHQYYDLAADVLAENQHLMTQYLSAELYDFLEATIMTKSAPEVGFGGAQTWHCPV